MEHTTSYEPFPALDSSYSAPTTPQHDHDAPIPTASDIATTHSASSSEPFSLHYDGPLYTEINIPLPHIPSAQNTPSASSPQPPSTPLSPSSASEKQRGRSRTLSSLSPFRHRRSSSVSTSSPTSPRDSSSSEDWPRIRKEVVKSREVHAMMNLRHQNKRGRSGTVDALAVVPAVLVLSAELFTPGEEARGEGRKDSGVGRWEDGIR